MRNCIFIAHLYAPLMLNALEICGHVYMINCFDCIGQLIVYSFSFRNLWVLFQFTMLLESNLQLLVSLQYVRHNLQ